MTGIAKIEAGLIALLRARGLREDSVKLTAGAQGTQPGADWDRALWSFDRSSLYPGPKARLGRVAELVGLAHQDVAILEPLVRHAVALHVGTEAAGGKIYLEFTADHAPEPDLVFLAVKPGGVAARYRRLARAAEPAEVAFLADSGPFRAMLSDSLALARQSGGDVLLVTETGSARRSIDANVADAGLKIGQMPGLAQVLAAMGFSSDQINPIADRSLGHIAIGLAKDNRPFVTLYHGARGVG